MDSRKPPEFTLELSADRSNVKDVFFHRYFTPLTPATHDVLDTTLPYVSEDDIESLIETRATAFVRSLDTATSTTPHTSPSHYNSKSAAPSPSRGTLSIKFLERKRRKGWFIAKADEETVWETWLIDVTLTSARSEPEAARNRRVMERSLQEAAMRVVEVVDGEKGHIPPITTNESNPFPYQIVIHPRGGG
ncbi:hypothetical protein LTR94_012469 [Friedmanniomyces endolithicus]|nr:hypothetical protein LTR94_012469 [Friedmanniomyces endolithicus]KAK0790627.1 hypothetical protein LTR75_011993 [Friedmanniomyces endolithicus]KAK0803523.1 hypothetical protein LTR38_006096 [Friedmanniomyces endolithicus]